MAILANLSLLAASQNPYFCVSELHLAYKALKTSQGVKGMKCMCVCVLRGRHDDEAINSLLCKLYLFKI